MIERQNQPQRISLAVGTLIAVDGSCYRLRFPATFYPSKRDPAYGQRIDQWGNRSFVTVLAPPATNGKQQHRPAGDQVALTARPQIH